MRITPSSRQRSTARSLSPGISPARKVGSRKNRPTENSTPSTTESDTTNCWSFSDPSFFSSQRSNFDGSPSSSGKKSAEYISALTPLTMEDPKLTTPRMSGHVRMLFLFLTGSTLVTSPSGPRTTMARLSGPCIRMPSISACPPISVLNFSCDGFCFFSVMEVLYSSPTGMEIVTSVPPPSAFSSVSTPPCIVTISSQTARPMPLPRALELPL